MLQMRLDGLFAGGEDAFVDAAGDDQIGIKRAISATSQPLARLRRGTCRSGPARGKWGGRGGNRRRYPRGRRRARLAPARVAEKLLVVGEQDTRMNSGERANRGCSKYPPPYRFHRARPPPARAPAQHPTARTIPASPRAPPPVDRRRHITNPPARSRNADTYIRRPAVG